MHKAAIDEALVKLKCSRNSNVVSEGWLKSDRSGKPEVWLWWVNELKEMSLNPLELNRSKDFKLR